MSRLILSTALLTVLLVPLASGSASELQLVVNSGFEPPLDNGWTVRTLGSSVSVTTSLAPDPFDMDCEAKLTKGSGTGYGRLMQTMVLPGLDVDVSVDLKCDVVGDGTAWAAGGFIVEYQASDGAILGRTAYLQRSPACPWTESDVLHLIDVDPNRWDTYGFNVATELDNLPGVPRDAVFKLGVMVFVEVADC